MAKQLEVIVQNVELINCGIEKLHKNLQDSIITILYWLSLNNLL